MSYADRDRYSITYVVCDNKSGVELSRHCDSVDDAFDFVEALSDEGSYDIVKVTTKISFEYRTTINKS